MRRPGSNNYNKEEAIGAYLEDISNRIYGIILNVIGIDRIERRSTNSIISIRT